MRAWRPWRAGLTPALTLTPTPNPNPNPNHNSDPDPNHSPNPDPDLNPNPKQARRPQSVDEIGAAKREWTSIYGSKDEVKAKFKKLEELSRMMRQVSRTGLEPYPYP